MFHNVITILVCRMISDHWKPGQLVFKITIPFSKLESGDSWEGDTARQEFWEFWLADFPANIPGAAALARWEEEDDDEEKEEGKGMKSSPREFLCNSTSTTYRKEEINQTTTTMRQPTQQTSDYKRDKLRFVFKMHISNGNNYSRAFK